jgi:hypothetical protein
LGSYPGDPNGNTGHVETAYSRPAESYDSIDSYGKTLTIIYSWVLHRPMQVLHKPLL